MIEKFIATNGIEVRLIGTAGTLKLSNGLFPSRESVIALREFFLSERDEALGRWRWPDNPDYVVYPLSDNVVEVFDEAHGQSATYSRGTASDTFPDSRAARDYFDAHPEPKPWHDAKSGEVWEVTFSDDGGGGTEPYTVDRECRFVHPNYMGVVRRNDSTIIAARRIWPEK